MFLVDPQEEKNGGFLKSIDRKKLQEAYKDFMVEEYSNPYECEVGDESCLENEICVPTKKRSPIGKLSCLF